MGFECQQCGECCSHMGLVHCIQEASGKHAFVIRNLYTGERTAVRVDPDKIRLFEDRSLFERFPEACPFLRSDPEHDRICCTVHLTRPEICRDFGCWRLLILDARGRRAGRVMGQGHLVSEDDALTAIWDRSIRGMPEPDAVMREKEICRILEDAGYTVRW